jgi:SRSO17 transposase
VGVARRYSGTLGKTGNCHYAERTIAWPVATRLYLPKKEWAENDERRRRAGVPEELVFGTKAEIALAILDRAWAWGVPHALRDGGCRLWR